MKIKIIIVHNDLKYALKLSEALYILNKNFKICFISQTQFSIEKYCSYILVSPYKEIFEAYKLQGVLLPGETETPMAASELAQRLLALHWGCSQPPKLCEWKNCKATAFISAYGGSGKTAAAVCYGRQLARFAGARPVFVSLDPARRSAVPAGTDEYGLCFARFRAEGRAAAALGTDGLSTAENFFNSVTKLIETENYSHLIIDIPSDINFQPYIDMCENRVVTYGWHKNRYVYCDNLYSALQNRSKSLGQSNVLNLKFFNSFDQNSFEDNIFGDIHGQLGKEVLELAGKLERK